MTTLHLSADPRSVTIGRHAARDQLYAWGLGRLVDDVQLLVAELVANAVRHTFSDVVLELHREGAQLRIAVTDDNPRMLPGRTTDEHLPETGRGLRLVAALSRDWGVEPAGRGKRVWCLIALGEPQTRDADVLQFGSHRGEELATSAHEQAPQDTATGSAGH